MTFTDTVGHEPEEFEVIYIEYFDGIPHSILTTNGTYNCDPYGGDRNDLMLFNSGSGSSDNTYTCYAIPGRGCQLWINPAYRDRWQLIDCTPDKVSVLSLPIQLTIGYVTNPFDMQIGRIVGDITYCGACDKFYDEDYCPEHDCEFTEGAEEEWASRNPDAAS